MFAWIWIKHLTVYQTKRPTSKCCDSLVAPFEHWVQVISCNIHHCQRPSTNVYEPVWQLRVELKYQLRVCTIEGRVGLYSVCSSGTYIALIFSGKSPSTNVFYILSQPDSLINRCANVNGHRDSIACDH